ncbi:MAG: hypothetical protein LIP16_12365 [Clostridium sp.]|nr:hypothetical protein [Clostridium sp.]
MSRLNVKHVVIVILLSWAVALSPFFIPSLNVTTQILGVPVTVWIAIIAFAMNLVINALAVKYAWDDFDEDDSEEKEV